MNKNKNMSMNMKVIAGILVVALGALGFLAYSNTSDKEDTMMKAQESMAKADEVAMTASGDVAMTNSGDAAPQFELASMTGDTVSLAGLKGEKVYVKFWASWCSICLAGMEELNALAENPEGFKVYTIVSPGQNGEQEKAAFIKWFGTLGYDNVEVLFDETGDVQKAYGVRAFPTSAYIGSDGVLVKSAPGHMSNEAIKAAFDGIN